MRKLLRFGILNALLLILSVALALAWQHELRRRLALTDRINSVLAHPVLQISHHQSNRYYKHAEISIGGLYFLPANDANPPRDVSLLATLYHLGEDGDKPVLSCTDSLGPFRDWTSRFCIDTAAGQSPGINARHLRGENRLHGWEGRNDCD